MPGMANGKLRILYIMRMLQEETDAARGLSMSEIIRRLADCGMTADRKTIYTDLDTLRAFGLVIKTVQRNPVEYFIENRDFELSELMPCKAASSSRRSNAIGFREMFDCSQPIISEKNLHAAFMSMDASRTETIKHSKASMPYTKH